MQTIPFSPEERELAIALNRKGLFWRPKSSDWFLDLSRLRVNYKGEYIQSVSLSLVIDEDGRSFSFLELIIDGEENGNRMKRSLSYSDRETMEHMNWLPSVKDCIDLINRNEDFRFLKLENEDNYSKVSVLSVKDNKVISESGETELIAFYSLILKL